MARGAVDSKTGSMVWRITQNVFFERARQPHNFRSPRWLLGHVRDALVEGYLASCHGRVVAAAGVHPAAVFNVIVVALPMWAAMYASQL